MNKISKFSYVLVIFLLACEASNAEFKVEDLFDPPPTAQAFDLLKTPLLVTVLRESALKLTNTVLKSQFSDELQKLVKGIGTSLNDKPYGSLLKVELYSDEFGTPIIPSGQLIFSMGYGSEPIDALAEYIRLPQLRVPKPNVSIDNSYYIWIKYRSGKLSGSAIPRQFTKILESKANAEGIRRNEISSWTRAINDSGISQVQRSKYWSDVAFRYSDSLKTKVARDQINGLNKQFKAAEQEFNKSYYR